LIASRPSFSAFQTPDMTIKSTLLLKHSLGCGNIAKVKPGGLRPSSLASHAGISATLQNIMSLRRMVGRTANHRFGIIYPTNRMQKQSAR
jgi:hypothetical protein